MWLKEIGALDPAVLPLSRVTRSNVRAFMQARLKLGNSYRTLENYGTSLRHIMRVLAPSEDWSWLLPMIERFKKAQVKKPMTGLPSIRELFELGIAVMKAADNPCIGTLRDRAFPFRNGLAVALLAARPFMRRKNLSQIEIGKHLYRDGDDYRLSFADADMKQNEKSGATVPAILTAYIDRYLEIYRVAILNGKGDPGPALWVSHSHGAVGAKPLANEIADLTEAAFGRRISPHKFRHCAGTSFATEDPTNILNVQAILGHSSFEVGEKFYIFANHYLAHVLHDKTLTAIAKDKSTFEVVEPY